MVKLNKIYTRTGDDGTTGLVDASRIAKNDPLMEAIGAVDETNSAIGVAMVAMEHQPIFQAMLSVVQNDLFDLGADLATPAGPGPDFSPSEMVLRIVASQIVRLENQIDTMNETIAPLTSFILPGGSEAAARIHVARATARRAERAMVAVSSQRPINPDAIAYINRLSDYLFVMARAINIEGRGDVLWVPGASR